MGFTSNGELIGRGTYGAVFSGEVTTSDGRVEKAAQKWVFFGIHYSGFGILREIHIIRELSSHCIFFPRLLDVDYAPYERKSTNPEVQKIDGVKFSTEYMGLNGAIFFKNRAYDITTVISLTSQLLIGVGYMHDKFITHRDIKPANILISEENGRFRLKICDFGLSQYLVNSAPSTPQVNTPWYRAPEVCWSNTKYGIASDVWSVGATIYELLTGQILMQDSEPENDKLFFEMLRRIPVPWTEEIHKMYLRNTNIPLKINNSLEPINYPTADSFMVKFRKTRFYRNDEMYVWLEFENLLKDCFNFHYKDRRSAWDLLNSNLFLSLKNQINNTMVTICKKKYNDVINFSINPNYNARKVQYYQNLFLRTKKFSLRKLFHSVDLVNRVLENLSYFDAECNVEKVTAACVYFYEKFFVSLHTPETMVNFFYGIVIHQNYTDENFYELDRWIYEFELKLIQKIFPTFKFYRPGLFEMPDDYQLNLTYDQFKSIFNLYINTCEWNGSSYRNMFRVFYKQCINPDYIF